jgi:hypothetical protein
VNRIILELAAILAEIGYQREEESAKADAETQKTRACGQAGRLQTEPDKARNHW